MRSEVFLLLAARGKRAISDFRYLISLTVFVKNPEILLSVDKSA